MASNAPSATEGYTWVTAQVTHEDKATLLRLTELHAHENGTVGNMSATLRRLIRQEAQRRLVSAEAVPA